MRLKVVLLCEDQQTDSFVRRFLWRRNFRGRDVRSGPFPRGGSGEQWVRTRFPAELTHVRKRNGWFLIAVLDADAGSVQDRLSQLAAECNRQGVPAMGPDDPVIVAVPRRNVETWFEFLRTGADVDETEDYSLSYKGCSEHERRTRADELYRMCHEHQEMPDNAPPSLRATCEQYPKLKR